MKKVLLASLIIILAAGIGYAQSAKDQLEKDAHMSGDSVISPTANPTPTPAGANRASLLFTIDVSTLTGDDLCVGVDYDATLNSWWVTGGKGPWNMYLIDYAGTTFTAYPNGTTWYSPIDIADCDAGDVLAAPYDYEGYDNEMNLYTNGVFQNAVSEITFYDPTGQAYHPATDKFYVAEQWDGPIHILDNGPYPGTPDIPVTDTLGLDKAGFGMDGDILLIFAQNGPDLCDVYGWDTITQDYTGDMWSADGSLGIAGGGCVYTDPTHGLVYAGIQQGAVDVIAVYSTAPSPFPQLDIKANGADSGVVVPLGDNVTVPFDVDERDFGGFPVDIWVLAINKSTGDMFTFGDGRCPSFWKPGVCNCFHSGGLTSYFGVTALDMALSEGSYEFYVAIDMSANRQLNMPLVFDYDMVDVQVIDVSGFSEDFDDGVADNWIDDGAHWSVTGGVYYLDTPSYANWLSYYDFNGYADFTYSADVMMVDTGNTTTNYYSGIYFRSDGTLSNCYTVYSEYGGTVYVYKYVGGSSTLIASDTPASFISGVGMWNNFKVVCSGSNVDVYINDTLEPTLSFTDSDLTSGYVGVRGEGTGIYDHEYQFDNIILSL